MESYSKMDHKKLIYVENTSMCQSYGDMSTHVGTSYAHIYTKSIIQNGWMLTSTYI